MDKENLIEQLTRIAKRIKLAERNVEKVILFGPLVEQPFSPLLDVQVLILLREDKDPIIDRVSRFLYYFMEAPVPVQIFPYTEKEVLLVPSARRALAKGIVLA